MSDPSAEGLLALLPRLREIRHDLHQHPELGFEEHRTQGIVGAWLREHGYQPRDCAGTGLVADLHPQADPDAPCIALRADLDCLPMHEATDLPYRSVHEGRAHKCGHDGHTAILMGVAARLAAQRERLAGNVRLLFQPAEEGVRGGGARVMVAEGALAGVAEVYGLHNWPSFPRGHVRVRSGAMMADARRLEIVVHGTGGHASEPERCRDPIVAAAHLVVALQTVVSRGVGSHGGAVVSICRVAAGDAHNVIPDRAELWGTVRTFDPAVTERVLERIEEVATGIAAAFGVRVELLPPEGYPLLVNAPRCADAVRRVAERVVGPSRVGDEGLPLGAGEDFAYLAQAVPGAYFFLGAGDPAGTTPGCHHPDFDFDDELIPLGIEMFLGLVDDRLRELSAQ
ncbi:MAG: amidohydrolase [Myxococcales bacterium]|nr:amidohydrolase [Myxococcales bacterium]MCB9716605.1 amidohydrolase [Myxococcales bacterium]